MIILSLSYLFFLQGMENSKIPIIDDLYYGNLETKTFIFITTWGNALCIWLPNFLLSHNYCDGSLYIQAVITLCVREFVIAEPISLKINANLYHINFDTVNKTINFILCDPFGQYNRILCI